MAEKKAVLIIGGGLLSIATIQEAKRLGLYTICTDGNPVAPGKALADDFFHIDIYDTEAHADLAWLLGNYADERYVLGGVVSGGTDTAPTVAAAVSGTEREIAGLAPYIAWRTHNKALVRTCLHEHGLDRYQPAWAIVSTNIEQALTVRPLALEYPLVVKPVASRASRGVSIATSWEATREAMAKALKYGGADILVEERLYGTEHSSEIIFGNNGEVLWWNIVDRYFDYTSGIPIELGHLNPTELDERSQQQIFFMMLAAARALGVTWGPWKIDVMMTSNGPKILECAARLSGSFDSQWTSPATGRNPIRLLLQLACGLPVEEQPSMGSTGKSAASAAIIHDGCVQRKQEQGPERPVEDMEIIWMIQEGQIVPPLEHNAGRVGYVNVARSTGEAAWDDAHRYATQLALHALEPVL